MGISRIEFGGALRGESDAAKVLPIRPAAAANESAASSTDLQYGDVMDLVAPGLSGAIIEMHKRIAELSRTGPRVGAFVLPSATFGPNPLKTTRPPHPVDAVFRDHRDAINGPKPELGSDGPPAA